MGVRMKIRAITVAVLGLMICTFLVSCGSKDETQKLLSKIEDKEVDLEYIEATLHYTGYLDNVSSMKETFDNLDYDSDGLQDRVVQYVTEESSKHYYIVFGSGEILELGPFLDIWMFSTFQAADLTGDGNNEIIFCGEHSLSSSPESGSEIAVFGRVDGTYKQLVLPASEPSWNYALYYTGFPIFGEINDQGSIITFSCPILGYEEKYNIIDQNQLDTFLVYHDMELAKKKQLAFDAYHISLEESDEPRLILKYGIFKIGPFFEAVLEWDGEKFIGTSMKFASFREEENEAKQEEINRFSQEDMYIEGGSLLNPLSEGDRQELLTKMEQASLDIHNLSDYLLEIYRNPEKQIVLYGYAEPECYYGCGILWVNQELETISIFPDVLYGKAQNVSYDEINNRFLYTSMDGGTGVAYDTLYVFDNLPDGSVEWVYTIVPDDISKTINESIEMKLDSKKDEIVYYYKDAKIGVSKFSDYYPIEEFLGIYIGDILSYRLDEGNIIVEFSPGYQYESVSSLEYDTSPRMQGNIDLIYDNNTFSYELSAIKFVE